MSFVDLATLTLHRRHELENRIHIFEEKCDRAINDLEHLKKKAKGFVSQLNCDPSELKDRFLSVMQKLDEYMYLVTDFNLAMGQTADSIPEQTPVQDTSTSFPASLSPFNLIDALTEPRPTTSHACPNLCPQDQVPTWSTPKAEQKLILFSGSSSAESVQRRSEKELHSVVEDMKTLTVEVPAEATPATQEAPETECYYKECCISAAQPLLEVDHEYYDATITAIDGGALWIITDDVTQVARFMTDMTEYYTNNKQAVSVAELSEMTYCAYRCEDGCYYRAMFLDKPKGDEKSLNLYVVDTGEIRTARIEDIQPLHRQFCSRPPYARFCHLAGVDLGDGYNKKLVEDQDAFMREYCNTQCTILIDDNSSESFGVYVILPSSNKTLNELLVENNLAVPIDKPKQPMTPAHPRSSEASPRPVAMHGPPPTNEDEWRDIMQCPEYEDPVVAVTGYHNRDEADICKHYKGGPDKTCFKGARCTKKHILHHPDGWTLDQVPILVKCESIPLPAPGTCVKVLVTSVCHFDRLFVQLVEDQEEEAIPEFGLVLPPKTLDSLRRDMNSPAAVQAYKRLTISPAPGEMVAALYHDNCWYRARVRTVTRADQCVEVIYVDYGTVVWVREDQIRALEPRFLSLPIQALQCVLAGVLQSGDSERWARAKRALTEMVMDRELIAHVIAREFDEIVVELTDDLTDPTRGQSVAERLCELGLVELGEFSVADDSGVTQKLVVP